MLKKRRNDSHRKLNDMVPDGSSQDADTTTPKRVRIVVVPHEVCSTNIASDIIEGQGIESVDDGSTIEGVGGSYIDIDTKCARHRSLIISRSMTMMMALEDATTFIAKVII